MIQKIFSLLNDWRQLPAYQLERRTDIYFAAFLDKIFNAVLSENVIDIIPEFPIRIGTIYPAIDINQSYKVDYVVFTQSNKIYLVELKTDNGSIREEQYKYYFASIEAGIKSILNGLIQIYNATDYKSKYEYLLRKLVNNGAISINKNEYIPTDKYFFHSTPIFIKPTKNQDDEGIVINFDSIINVLNKESDETSKHFVKALAEWKEPV